MEKTSQDELRDLLEMKRGMAFTFKLLSVAEKYPLDSRILDLFGKELWSGVFDDVVSTQMEGWGAETFLVHEKSLSRQVVAEFRVGSGNLFDRHYAAHALRTWHLLAAEILRLREQLGEATSPKSEPMTREELKAKHPELEYLEFGEGWNELMDRAATAFEEIRKDLPELRIIGGKQKYAAMEIFVVSREGFSASSEDPRVEAFCEKVQKLSERICESCGAPGVWRDLSWEQILCAECYASENDEEIGPVDLDAAFGVT